MGFLSNSLASGGVCSNDCMRLLGNLLLARLRSKAACSATFMSPSTIVGRMRWVFSMLVLAATTGASAAECQLVKKGFGPKGQAHVSLETVVIGLEVPWGIAFLPRGDAL